MVLSHHGHEGGLMRCRGCGRTPNEIQEYVVEVRHDDRYDSPAEFVRDNDGTYDADTQSFLCTKCYVERDMASYSVI